MALTGRRLLQGAVFGLSLVGALLLVAAAAMWATLYNDPCSAYSWDRESGDLLQTQFEPELCYRGGPEETFTGTLLFAGWGPYFSPKTDAVIGDESWVPARLPGVFQHYIRDHVAPPDREGHAFLQVQFVGHRLDRYSTPFFRIYSLDGPGDSVIYIKRLTRVEPVMRNPERTRPKVR